MDDASRYSTCSHYAQLSALDIVPCSARLSVGAEKVPGDETTVYDPDRVKTCADQKSLEGCGKRLAHRGRYDATAQHCLPQLWQILRYDGTMHVGTYGGSQ
jgi:hypothetical protein